MINYAPSQRKYLLLTQYNRNENKHRQNNKCEYPLSDKISSIEISTVLRDRLIIRENLY